MKVFKIICIFTLVICAITKLIERLNDRYPKFDIPLWLAFLLLLLNPMTWFLRLLEYPHDYYLRKYPGKFEGGEYVYHSSFPGILRKKNASLELSLKEVMLRLAKYKRT